MAPLLFLRRALTPHPQPKKNFLSFSASLCANMSYIFFALRPHFLAVSMYAGLLVSRWWA